MGGNLAEHKFQKEWSSDAGRPFAQNNDEGGLATRSDRGMKGELHVVGSRQCGLDLVLVG